MTSPVQPVDRRLTKKAAAHRTIILMCKNHPEKFFETLNMPGQPITFGGEAGKLNHHGLIPPFKSVMKDIVSGKAAKRDAPIEFTAEAVAQVAAQYVSWEKQYAFECECPTKDLVISPRYNNMAEVPA